MVIPNTKEEEIEFLENSMTLISTSLSANIQLRNKYKLIMSKLTNKKDKELYKEKLDKVNKDIEYYQKSLDYINKRIEELES